VLTKFEWLSLLQGWEVIGKIVSLNQHALIHGRQILDGALIASHSADCYFKSNQSSVLCKLDIEKTCNHISWLSYGYS